MWEGSYGKEPFDLRLTGLRLIRNLIKIASVMILGTALFGGGYYVKNVLLYKDHVYAAVSVYKVEYEVEPAQSGDYYINTMTWNTYVHSQEFQDAFFMHFVDLPYIQSMSADIVPRSTAEFWEDIVEVKMESDWHVPSVVVTTQFPDWSIAVAQAVEQTMTQEFVENNPQVKSITVIDPADEAPEVLPDVRPVRAVILSAVLSCFFAVILWLLLEISADSIWLPAALRKRYGLPAMGTVGSRELLSNLEYRFGTMTRIAVCAAGEDMDPVKICEAIRECASASILREKQWIPVPAPLLCTESCQLMRDMDGVLLVVRAGSYVGKPLERVLEYLTEQEISVTGALLWEPDEWLLRWYYLTGGSQITEGGL